MTSQNRYLIAEIFRKYRILSFKFVFGDQVFVLHFLGDQVFQDLLLLALLGLYGTT